jgi:TonB family protein
MKPKTTALLGLVLSLIMPSPGLSATPARTAPKPIETPSPAYPAVLESTGARGRAVIEVLVRADGSTAEPRVESADHEAFGAAALEVLPRWRFEPGSRDGMPADMRVKLPFEFTPPVQQQLNALFKRRVFQPVSGPVLSVKEFGKRPKPQKPIQAVYPKGLAGSRIEETVEVRFVIAPDGTTINPDVNSGTRKELVVPAFAAVVRAKFPPPVKDGKPVYVASSVKLKFAPPQPARRANRGGGGDFGGGGFGGGGFGGGGGDPD